MLTAEHLRKVLHYDPATGSWRWLVTLSNRAVAGSSAGSLRKRGDITIRIGGVEYKSHRLAYLYMTGSWPADQVDHRDRVRSHNWWTNIRPADNSQNGANKPVRSDSKTGVKNVAYYPDKSKANPYVAFGQRQGKRVWLGAYPSVEAAAAAAFKHAKAEFGAFAHA